VVAVIAVCLAMLGASAVRSSAASGSSGEPMAMQMSGSITPSQLALRNRMRVLWEQHVAWTRLAIVGFAGGLGDLPATEARLLRNQTDIGNAIIPFYGEAAGHQLTALLRQHILQAVVILGDVKHHRQAALQRDLRAWYANADRIASFLHAANPDHWPLRAMRRMMHTHLALTTIEAVDELSGSSTGSVAAYDRVEREILGMADMLSTGIIAQFPGRFS
jgi:hypothetical protein